MESSIDELRAALHMVADTTSDPTMHSTACFHARQLSEASPANLEAVVRDIGHNLSWHKSDYRDSPDQSSATRAALEKAESAAKEATNRLVVLRRPDLAFLTNTKLK